MRISDWSSDVCSSDLAGTQYLFGMIRPDILRGSRAEAELVNDGACIPGFAHTEAVHVSNAHVGHHLRGRHRDCACRGRVYAVARQPVVQPHRMCTRGERVGEGVLARVGGDLALQRFAVGYARSEEHTSELQSLKTIS